MSYGPGAGRGNSTGRTRGFDKPKKAKTRKSSTHHTVGSPKAEGGVQSHREVVDRTLASLDNLGLQTFATPPFQQHFDRWMKGLVTVLDDFEAGRLVEIDDVFREQRGSILSAVEAALKVEQAKEVTRSATLLGMHSSKDMLLHAEQEHDAKLRELSTRREQALKLLNDTAMRLRVELDEVLDTKVSFFERFTNSRAKKEKEAKVRIADAEKGVDVTKARFAEELIALQSSYALTRQEILEKVAAERKDIDRLSAEAEVDGSVEIRRVACEELAQAVGAQVNRALEKKPVTD
jgi:hypothetical protein